MCTGSIDHEDVMCQTNLSKAFKAILDQTVHDHEVGNSCTSVAFQKRKIAGSRLWRHHSDNLRFSDGLSLWNLKMSYRSLFQANRIYQLVMLTHEASEETQ